MKEWDIYTDFDTNYKISKPDIRCREFSLHRNVHLIKKESHYNIRSHHFETFIWASEYKYLSSAKKR